jgi:hypothetical protein
MVELLAEAVSVTCSVNVAGEATWFLTRESGRIPLLCAEFACSSECECQGECVALAMEWGYRSKVLARSYVVLVVTGGDEKYGTKEVAVGQLTATNLDSVCAALRRGSGGTWGHDLMALFRAGGCSSQAMCRCALGPGAVVCAQCEQVVCSQRAFIAQDRFEGVDPCGQQHWWKGVTDAADEVTPNQMGWLVCAH